MQKMYKLLFILLFFISSSSSARAQEEVYTDTVRVSPPDAVDEEYVEVFEMPDTMLLRRDIDLSADSILLLKQRKEFAT